jgi:hypothetical protein
VRRSGWGSTTSRRRCSTGSECASFARHGVTNRKRRRSQLWPVPRRSPTAGVWGSATEWAELFAEGCARGARWRLAALAMLNASTGVVGPTRDRFRPREIHR